MNEIAILQKKSEEYRKKGNHCLRLADEINHVIEGMQFDNEKGQLNVMTLERPQARIKNPSKSEFGGTLTDQLIGCLHTGPKSMAQIKTELPELNIGSIRSVLNRKKQFKLKKGFWQLSGK